VNDDTLDRVIKIVSEQLNVNASGLNEKTSLIKDLEADSLDSVDIVMTIE
jgi:acyl carrier protein